MKTLEARQDQKNTLLSCLIRNLCSPQTLFIYRTIYAWSQKESKRKPHIREQYSSQVYRTGMWNKLCNEYLIIDAKWHGITRTDWEHHDWDYPRMW